MNPKSMTQMATCVPPMAPVAPHGGIAHAGRQLGGGEPVRVGLLVDEPQGIDRLEPGVALRPRSRIEEVVETGAGRQAEVVPARRAHPQVLLELLVEQHRRAGRALGPQVGRIDVAPGAERRQLERHQAVLRRAAARIALCPRDPAAGRLRRQATKAAPASEIAADVSTPPMTAGRNAGLATVRRDRDIRDDRGSREGDELARRRRQWTMRQAAPRGLPRSGTTGDSAAGRRPAAAAVARSSGGTSVTSRWLAGQQRLEVAIDDERLVLAVPRAEPAGHRRSRSSDPSSPATWRRPRWMSTRTAPSDRPRIAAISAVVISWTKRRTTARRRSPLRPSTARSAAAVASRSDHGPLDVGRVRRRVVARSSGASGRRRRPRRRSATTLRAMRNSQILNVDASGPSSGRARSSNPASPDKRGQERPLGGVLGLVMVAELVDREVVHLGQVLPIQGIEPSRVGPRRFHQGPIAVQVSETRTIGRLRSCHLPQCRSGHRVTPPPGPATTGAGRRDVPDLADEHLALAVRDGPVLDDQRAGHGVHAERPDRGRGTVRGDELDVTAGRDLPRGPRRRVEAAGAQRLDRSLEAGQERVEQRAVVDGRARGRLEQRGHRARELRRERRARPVRVQADADDRARVGPAQPVGLAEHARELADRRATSAAASVAPSDSTTRSFGHFSRIVPAGNPAIASAASAIASETVAARRQTRAAASQVGRNPSDSRRAAPAGAGHVRPSRPRPAVCSSATARQTSGVPSASQPRTTSLVEPTTAKCSRRARKSATVGRLSRPPRPRSAPVAPARTRRAARAAPSRARPRRSCR